jgi:hypothetical protein
MPQRRKVVWIMRARHKPDKRLQVPRVPSIRRDAPRARPGARRVRLDAMATNGAWSRIASLRAWDRPGCGRPPDRGWGHACRSAPWRLVEPGRVLPADLAVEGEQRRERLRVGRGRDASAGRRSIEVGRGVLAAERSGAAAGVALEASPNPAELGLLRARAPVTQAHRRARPLSEAERRAASGRGG